MSERLPFPIHGTRQHDGADAALMAEAARLLYTVNLLASTSGVPVQQMTLETEKGTVTASVHGPLTFKSTRPKKPEEAKQETSIARLAWLPEGFVITPRTAEAPDGYGMPPTENGRGTPGGLLTEVIINRYKNNQYPDALVNYLPKGIPRTAPYAANPFYMDWELAFSDPLPKGTTKPAADPTNTGPASDFSIGAGTKKLWAAQFRKKGDGLGGEKVSRFDTVFREPEDTNWHCHRPQHERETTIQKQIRESVNALREKVSADPPLKPLSPPLKGTEGLLSRTPLYLVQMTGVLGHSNPNYREGHKTFEMRSMFRDGMSIYSGENLLVSEAFTNPTLTRGAEITEWFSKSPPHYENMITDWHAEGQVYATVQSAVITVRGIHSKQMPPYELGSPTVTLPKPISGFAASQIFLAYQHLAHFGPCGREEPEETGTDGEKKPRAKRIGITDGMAGAAFFSPFLLSSGGADPYLRPPAFMTFMGRRVYVTKSNDQDIVAVLAARHIVTETKEFIRAVVLSRPVFTKGLAVEDHNPETFAPSIKVIDGAAHDFFDTQTVVASFAIPAKTSVMSTAKMSKSGKKVVFCYAEPVPCLKRFIYSSFVLDPDVDTEYVVLTDPEVDMHQDGYETPYAHRRYVWGEKLHFMEWDEDSTGDFAEVAVESLDITPKYKYETRTNDLNESETEASIVTTCKGNYRLFADYNGETLVYAKVYVDSRQDSILAVFDEDTKDKQYTRSLRGRIVFPDSTEFVFSEIDVDHPVVMGDSVTGLYRQILWMDIMRPKDIVYLHHELRGQHRIAAEGTLYSRGKEVKKSDGSTRKADDTLKNEVDDINLIRQRHESDKLIAMGRYPLLQDGARQGGLSPFAAINDADTGKTLVTVAPYDANRYSPPFAYKARLVAAITGDLNVGGRYYTEGFGKKHYYFSDLVGPEVLFISPMGRAQAEFYKDEAIVAGEFAAPFISARKVWEGDARFFHESSLKLREITGLDDLKNNILPIGVI